MKRIEVVKVQVVREKILYYAGSRGITSPQDAADLLQEYIGNADREYLVVMMLSTKNMVHAIHTVSIRSLNASVVHTREAGSI